MSHKRIDAALSPIISNPVDRKKAINHGFIALPYPTRYNLPNVTAIRKTLTQAGIPPNTIERFFTRGI